MGVSWNIFQRVAGILSFGKYRGWENGVNSFLGPENLFWQNLGLATNILHNNSPTAGEHCLFK